MFEQASIESPGLLRRPWAITISLAGQATAVSAIALISLVHVESLPPATFFVGVPAPSRPEPPHPRSGRTATEHPRQQSPIVFTAPSLIPAGIHPAGPAAPLLLPDDGALGSGVSGGLDGFSGQSSGLLRSLVRLPPAPPDAVRLPPEKPAASTRVAQLHVSTGVQAAKLLRQVNPVYPPLAKQARVAGTVRLTAIINREGAIRNLQLMSGHPLLAPAALAAVKHWLYQPTLLNGEPVEVITQIDVNFTLSR